MPNPGIDRMTLVTPHSGLSALPAGARLGDDVLEKEAAMHFTDREWWTLIHGMGFGALFLLAFAGGLAGLYSLRSA